MQLVLEMLPIDPARRGIEIVERKGAGHPDTLCDSAAEAFSRLLCRHYLSAAGRILHHNVDKALLAAGRTEVRFGGGEWCAPIRLFLGGRATRTVRGGEVPLEALAEAAAREALRPVTRLDPAEVELTVLVQPVAAELGDLFDRGAADVPRANDTSFGVGFAPLTATESVALAVERRLADPEVKAAVPALGEDVKVMAVRLGGRLHLTVAAAMVAAETPDAVAYVRAVEAVRELAAEVGRRHGFADVAIRVNAADAASGGAYLTLSGTSAECGDDGQVGRGNRISGLITPMRAMTLEAFAGKNPTSHVGKLLSLAATRAATACAKLPGVRAAECVLVSEIGSPLAEPKAGGMRLDADPADAAALRGPVEEIVARETARLPELWREILERPPLP